MSVSFSDPDLARLVNSVTALTARFGESTATTVLRRLYQLDAVADLQQASCLPGIQVSRSGTDTVVAFPADRLIFQGILETSRRPAGPDTTSLVIATLTVRTRRTERSTR